MIECDGSALLPVDTSSAQLAGPFFGFAEAPMLGAVTIPGGGDIEDTVLRQAASEADDWILPLLSSTSHDSLAAGAMNDGTDILLDRESNDLDDVVITGRRPTSDLDYWDGSTGYGAGGSSGGSSSGNSAGTGVEQHTQDCGSEDGAAVQVAKHVIGELPPNISGPPDRVLSTAGNDWTKVEFGAVIVRNPNGSFGALNDMIYSSNQAGWVGLPDSAGQPVQGIWHSHVTRDGARQQAIDRYPSPADWSALERIGKQTGSAADPSLWITGPDKITREFKLSERSYFEALDDDTTRMENGEGLEGRERASSCG
jgi:hypothetical protein